MRLLDVQTIGTELALKWEGGEETYVPLERLRRACPCAACQGEVDILGALHKAPQKPLAASAFVLRGWALVGGYGIQPTWGDGHASGIYSFDYLQRVAAV